MAYCHACGRYDRLDSAAMCPACRDTWQPSAPPAADLGTRHPGAP